MPKISSNIGPEAKAAYQKYLDAGSIDEKIKLLEEFISLVPKHKATEKIVALNRSRLAKLKRERDEKKQRIKSQRKVISPFSIKKEGIQIILISDYHTPGVGKTTLLNYLTNAAKDKIGRFTAVPEIGIFKYKKIRYQIVDMPSIMNGASKGVGNGKEILAQLRSCDLICFSIDLSRNIEEQMNLLLEEMFKADIRINVTPPPIDIEKTGSGNIQVFYISKDVKDDPEFTEKIKELVRESGIRNGTVKIYGNISMEQIVDELTPSIVYKKGIIIGTKGDLPHTKAVFKKLETHYSDRFPMIIGSSIKKGNFPHDFGETILEYLDKIRIYTMNAGIVAEKPLLLDKKQATVKDVALRIHRSFFELFDHAVIIREGARQRRKKVGLEYNLEDNDIIELHTI